MTLHENTELFSDAIIAASRPIAEGGLGIKDIFIEKDYWITRSLKLLSQVNTSQHAVFKGGTSLSKAYGIGARFSEDQQRFKQPEGWQERTIDDSVLITQLHDTWQKLQPTYMKELPDLAYREIPSSEQIENSMHTLLQCII